MQSDVASTFTQSDITATSTQSDITSVFTQSDVTLTLKQYDVTSTFTHSDITPTLTQSDIASTLLQTDVASTLTQSDITPILTQSDITSVLTMSDGTSTLASSDVTLSLLQSVITTIFAQLTQSDIIKTLTQSDVTTTLTQSDVIRTLTQSDVTTTLTQSDVITTLTQSDVTTTLTQSDVKPTLTQSDVTTTLTQSDVKPTLTQSDVTPTLTQSDVTPTLTQSDVTPILTQSDVITTITQSDVTTTLTQFDVTTTLTQSDVTTTLTQSDVIRISIYSDGSSKLTHSDAATSTLTQSDITSDIAQFEITSALAKFDVITALTKSHVTPILPHSDVMSSLIESDLTSILTHSDITPVLRQSHVTSTLTQSNTISTSLQYDVIPTITQSYVTSTLTQSEITSTLSQPDVVPTSTHSDIISTLIQSDISSAVTKSFVKSTLPHILPSTIATLITGDTYSLATSLQLHQSVTRSTLRYDASVTSSSFMEIYPSSTNSIKLGMSGSPSSLSGEQLSSTRMLTGDFSHSTVALSLSGMTGSKLFTNSSVILSSLEPPARTWRMSSSIQSLFLNPSAPMSMSSDVQTSIVASLSSAIKPQWTQSLMMSSIILPTRTQLVNQRSALVATSMPSANSENFTSSLLMSTEKSEQMLIIPVSSSRNNPLTLQSSVISLLSSNTVISFQSSIGPSATAPFDSGSLSENVSLASSKSSSTLSVEMSTVTFRENIQPLSSMDTSQNMSSTLIESVVLSFMSVTMMFSSVQSRSSAPQSNSESEALILSKPTISPSTTLHQLSDKMSSNQFMSPVVSPSVLSTTPSSNPTSRSSDYHVTPSPIVMSLSWESSMSNLITSTTLQRNSGRSPDATQTALMPSVSWLMISTTLYFSSPSTSSFNPSKVLPTIHTFMDSSFRSQNAMPSMSGSASKAYITSNRMVSSSLQTMPSSGHSLLIQSSMSSHVTSSLHLQTSITPPLNSNYASRSPSLSKSKVESLSPESITSFIMDSDVSNVQLVSNISSEFGQSSGISSIPLETTDNISSDLIKSSVTSQILINTRLTGIASVESTLSLHATLQTFLDGLYSVTIQSVVTSPFSVSAGSGTSLRKMPESVSAVLRLSPFLSQISTDSSSDQALSPSPVRSRKTESITAPPVQTNSPASTILESSIPSDVTPLISQSTALASDLFSKQVQSYLTSSTEPRTNSDGMSTELFLSSQENTLPSIRFTKSISITSETLQSTFIKPSVASFSKLSLVSSLSRTTKVSATDGEDLVYKTTTSGVNFESLTSSFVYKTTTSGANFESLTSSFMHQTLNPSKSISSMSEVTTETSTVLSRSQSILTSSILSWNTDSMGDISSTFIKSDVSTGVPSYVSVYSDIVSSSHINPTAILTMNLEDISSPLSQPTALLRSTASGIGVTSSTVLSFTRPSSSRTSISNSVTPIVTMSELYSSYSEIQPPGVITSEVHTSIEQTTTESVMLTMFISSMGQSVHSKRFPSESASFTPSLVSETSLGTDLESSTAEFVQSTTTQPALYVQSMYTRSLSSYSVVQSHPYHDQSTVPVLSTPSMNSDGTKVVSTQSHETQSKLTTIVSEYSSLSSIKSDKSDGIQSTLVSTTSIKTISHLDQSLSASASNIISLKPSSPSGLMSTIQSPITEYMTAESPRFTMQSSPITSATPKKISRIVSTTATSTIIPSGSLSTLLERLSSAYIKSSILPSFVFETLSERLSSLSLKPTWTRVTTLESNSIAFSVVPSVLASLISTTMLSDSSVVKLYMTPTLSTIKLSDVLKSPGVSSSSLLMTTNSGSTSVSADSLLTPSSILTTNSERFSTDFHKSAVKISPIFSGSLGTMLSLTVQPNVSPSMSRYVSGAVFSSSSIQSTSEPTVILSEVPSSMTPSLIIHEVTHSIRAVSSSSFKPSVLSKSQIVNSNMLSSLRTDKATQLLPNSLSKPMTLTSIISSSSPSLSQQTMPSKVSKSLPTASTTTSENLNIVLTISQSISIQSSFDLAMESPTLVQTYHTEPIFSPDVSFTKSSLYAESNTNVMIQPTEASSISADTVSLGSNSEIITSSMVHSGLTRSLTLSSESIASSFYLSDNIVQFLSHSKITQTSVSQTEVTSSILQTFGSVSKLISLDQSLQPSMISSMTSESLTSPNTQYDNTIPLSISMLSRLSTSTATPMSLSRMSDMVSSNIIDTETISFSNISMISPSPKSDMTKTVLSSSTKSKPTLLTNQEGLSWSFTQSTVTPSLAKNINSEITSEVNLMTSMSSTMMSSSNSAILPSRLEETSIIPFRTLSSPAKGASVTLLPSLSIQPISGSSASLIVLSGVSPSMSINTSEKVEHPSLVQMISDSLKDSTIQQYFTPNPTASGILPSFYLSEKTSFWRMSENTIATSVQTQSAVMVTDSTGTPTRSNNTVSDSIPLSLFMSEGTHSISMSMKSASTDQSLQSLKWTSEIQKVLSSIPTLTQDFTMITNSKTAYSEGLPHFSIQPFLTPSMMLPDSSESLTSTPYITTPLSFILLPTKTLMSPLSQSTSTHLSQFTNQDDLTPSLGRTSTVAIDIGVSSTLAASSNAASLPSLLTESTSTLSARFSAGSVSLTQTLPFSLTSITDSPSSSSRVFDVTPSISRDRSSTSALHMLVQSSTRSKNSKNISSASLKTSQTQETNMESVSSFLVHLSLPQFISPTQSLGISSPLLISSAMTSLSLESGSVTSPFYHSTMTLSSALATEPTITVSRLESILSESASALESIQADTISFMSNSANSEDKPIPSLSTLNTFPEGIESQSHSTSPITRAESVLSSLAQSALSLSSLVLTNSASKSSSIAISHPLPTSKITTTEQNAKSSLSIMTPYLTLQKEGMSSSLIQSSLMLISDNTDSLSSKSLSSEGLSSEGRSSEGLSSLYTISVTESYITPSPTMSSESSSTLFQSTINNSNSVNVSSLLTDSEEVLSGTLGMSSETLTDSWFEQDSTLIQSLTLSLKSESISPSRVQSTLASRYRMSGSIASSLPISAVTPSTLMTASGLLPSYSTGSDSLSTPVITSDVTSSIPRSINSERESSPLVRSIQTQVINSEIKSSIVLEESAILRTGSEREVSTLSQSIVLPSISILTISGSQSPLPVMTIQPQSSKLITDVPFLLSTVTPSLTMIPNTKTVDSMTSSIMQSSLTPSMILPETSGHQASPHTKSDSTTPLSSSMLSSLTKSIGTTKSASQMLETTTSFTAITMNSSMISPSVIKSTLTSPMSISETLLPSYILSMDASHLVMSESITMSFTLSDDSSSTTLTVISDNPSTIVILSDVRTGNPSSTDIQTRSLMPNIMQSSQAGYETVLSSLHSTETLLTHSNLAQTMTAFVDSQILSSQPVQSVIVPTSSKSMQSSFKLVHSTEKTPSFSSMMTKFESSSDKSKTLVFRSVATRESLMLSSFIPSSTSLSEGVDSTSSSSLLSTSLIKNSDRLSSDIISSTSILRSKSSSSKLTQSKLTSLDSLMTGTILNEAPKKSLETDVVAPSNVESVITLSSSRNIKVSLTSSMALSASATLASSISTGQQTIVGSSKSSAFLTEAVSITSMGSVVKPSGSLKYPNGESSIYSFNSMIQTSLVAMSSDKQHATPALSESSLRLGDSTTTVSLESLQRDTITPMSSIVVFTKPQLNTSTSISVSHLSAESTTQVPSAKSALTRTSVLPSAPSTITSDVLSTTSTKATAVTTTATTTATSLSINNATTTPPPKDDDIMLQIRIQVKQTVDVTTEEFRNNIAQGLSEAYVEAASTPTRRKRHIHHADRWKRQSSVQVEVTNITRNDVDDGVDVTFFISEDGEPVPAQTAMNQYNRLSDVETSAILGYPVLEPVSLALQAPTDQPAKTGLLGPFIIIIIAVPSAIVVVLTLGYFLMHWSDQPRTGTLTSVKSDHSGFSQKCESLADHDLAIDMEKGEIVSRSSFGSGRSTARRTSDWLWTIWDEEDLDLTDVKKPSEEVIEDDWDTISITLKSRSWSLKNYPFIMNEAGTRNSISSAGMQIVTLPDTNLDEVSQTSKPDQQSFDIIGKRKHHIFGLHETELSHKGLDNPNFRNTEHIPEDHSLKKTARIGKKNSDFVREPLLDIPVSKMKHREPFIGKRQKRKFKTNPRTKWKRRKAFKHKYEGFTNRYQPDSLSSSTPQNENVYGLVSDSVTTPTVDQFEVVSTYFGPPDQIRSEASIMQNFHGHSTQIITDPLSISETVLGSKSMSTSSDILNHQPGTPSWRYIAQSSKGREPLSMDDEQLLDQDTLPIPAVRFGSIDVIPNQDFINQDLQHQPDDFTTFPHSTIHERESNTVSRYSNFDVAVPQTGADTEQLISGDMYDRRTPVYGYSNDIFQNYQQTPIVRLQGNESQNEFYFAYDESQPLTDEGIYIVNDNKPQMNTSVQSTEPVYAHHSQDRQSKEVGAGRMGEGGLDNSHLFGLGDQVHDLADMQPTYIYLSGVSNNSYTEDGDLNSLGHTDFRKQSVTERGNREVRIYDDNFPMYNTQQSRMDSQPVGNTKMMQSAHPQWQHYQPILGHDYLMAETRFPSSESQYPITPSTNPSIVVTHTPQLDSFYPYLPAQGSSAHNLRIEGVEENESSTEADPVIGRELTNRQQGNNSGHYSQYPTSSTIQQSQSNGQQLDNLNMEVFAGQFENVAKMSRLAPSTGGSMAEKAPLPVKVRPVYYSPGPEAPAYRHSESDSRSDASTPRPPRPRGDRPTSGRDGQRVFYRAPFTGEPPVKMEEYSIEDKAGLEKWRNKQRQREFKQRLSKEEMEDDRKENRRRRILTRRQRDQLYRGYNDDLYDAYSDVEARYGYRQYASSRSGYSTPGGSCHSERSSYSRDSRAIMDERNLGRSMRAAPRHVRPGRTSRPASASKDKDLIEMLNRQQHMMLQQREQRHRFLEEQKIKQHAQQVVNRALLHDSFDERKLDSRDTKEMKQLLNDAFPLAGSSHNHLLSSNGIVDEERKSVKGDVTPSNNGYQSQTNDVVNKDKSGSNTPTSALNQLMTEGRISHQSSRRNSSQADNGDFFDTGRKEFPEDDAEKTENKDERQESEGKYMQAIRDELQRLNTS
ncbi:serine-rich adhesin for platelets-like [Argopecten irradians]|uniref:serine-rich adhesin for platelets-like n=1 Tax=Argopecten irradians TaxID=31199 RepID=UPI00372041C7